MFISEGNASIDVTFACGAPCSALVVGERLSDEPPKGVLDPNTAHFQMG